MQAAATMVTLAALAIGCNAQQAVPGISVRLLNVAAEGQGTDQPSGQIAAAEGIGFAATRLGSATRPVIAKFNVSGQGRGFVPTFRLHYGHDFVLGEAHCSGAGASESCEVPMSFSPTLPGGRPDALFVFDGPGSGATRLATVPVYGKGEGPESLIEAQMTAGAGLPAGASPGGLGRSSVLDENGTLYVLDRLAGTVTSLTSAGERTRLPIEGLDAARGMALNGAGLLYILPETAEKRLLTFDTVRGEAGAIALPVPANTLDGIAVDGLGKLYAMSSSARVMYAMEGSGGFSSTALQAGEGAGIAGAIAGMIRGENGDFFVGAKEGGGLLRVTSGGVQRRLGLGTAGRTLAGDAVGDRGAAAAGLVPVAVDAAGTLFVAAGDGLLRLPGADFATVSAILPAATSIASDGTLYMAGEQGFTTQSRNGAVLDFGQISPGDVQTEPKLVSIYNGGNEPLVLSNVEVQGTGYAVVSAGTLAASPCGGGVALAPGGACAIAVALTASGTKSFDGTLTISSDSLNKAGTTQVVELHANAGNGSQAVFSPTTLSFPSTTVNVASTPLQLMLSNPGTATLNISSIGLSGAGSGSFSLTQNCTPSVAPGGSCLLTVTFKPLAAGALSATITVLDDLNGTAGSTQTVAISGTGVAAPAPVIATSPGTLAFGSTSSVAGVVVVGTSSFPQNVTLTNTGNAVATISSITLTTTLGTLPYAQTNTCGMTLAAGANCVVTVIFSPTVGGATTASLLIADNAVGSPQTVAITGAATGADYNLTTTTTSLTLPLTGGTAQVSLTATPDPAPFPSPINFSVFGLPQGASYALNPSSINAMTAATTATMTITTTPYHSVMNSRMEPTRFGGIPMAPMAAFVLTGLCCGLRGKKMPRLTRSLQILLVAAIGFGAASLSGCSGGLPISSGVAPGTYTITVNAQSSNGAATGNGLFPTTHTVTITLNVQ